MNARRRKTPETPVAARIRAAASGYEADGRKGHAEGMRQAADMVDELSRRGGDVTWLLRQDAGETLSPREIKEAIDRLEKNVGQLLVAVFQKAPPSAPRVPEMDRKPRGGGATPRQIASRLLSDDAALSPGELRILASIAQAQDGRTLNELTAMVDLRATSLRTYLGNLRAAGYVVTEAGRHLVSIEGQQRAKCLPIMPKGEGLYAYWERNLTPGEKLILSKAKRIGGVAIRDLIGEATGLKATSVRTYVAALVRRRLIIREHGRIRLAPILLDESHFEEPHVEDPRA